MRTVVRVEIGWACVFFATIIAATIQLSNAGAIQLSNAAGRTMLESATTTVLAAGGAGSWIDVTVQIHCDGCSDRQNVKHYKGLHFLPDVKAAIGCTNQKLDRVRFAAISSMEKSYRMMITDAHGKFVMRMPSKIVRSKETRCFVRILSSPRKFCAENTSFSRNSQLRKSAAASASDARLIPLHFMNIVRKGRKNVAVHATGHFLCPSAASAPPTLRSALSGAMSTLSAHDRNVSIIADQKKSADVKRIGAVNWKPKLGGGDGIALQGGGHDIADFQHEHSKRSKQRTRGPAFSFPFAPPFRFPGPPFQLPPAGGGGGGGSLSPPSFPTFLPPSTPPPFSFLPPFLQPGPGTPPQLPPLFPIPNPPPTTSFGRFQPFPGFVFPSPPPPPS